jgi:hypothetical protein
MRKKVNIAPQIDAKKSGGISVVQLSNYTSPKVVELKSQEWVSYGEDNNYFGYLQDRINGSPTNNAVVNGISQMIFGKGLDATDAKEKPLEFAKMKQLFNDDMVERLCYDLKSMGQCAIQVVYSIDKTQILQCNHFPIETLRSGKCNDDGDIETYYYAENWTEISRSKKPTPIPAFGFGSKSEDAKNVEEILYVKFYKTGFYYYSPVDYQGGLQYAELEEEISNYHLNNIMNGLAPSMLINFNNGTPTEDEQRDIERNIQKKFGGSSNAGRFILSFNDNANNTASITPVQLSDAHNQYQFLSDESMKKIMVSHRVVSPMLLGIRDNAGFGNNADELQTASILMDNTVIRPFNNLLINAFNKILSFNKMSLNLYFKPLQPLDANNELTITEKSNTIIDGINSLSPLVANKVLESMSADEIRSLVGLKAIPAEDIKPQSLLPETLSGYDIDLSEYGEQIDLEIYELIDARPVDYDQEPELDAQLSVHLASVSSGTAYGNANSREDSPIYKVRYRYDGKEPAERAFCNKMMRDKKVYRKEDIEKMSQKNVNPGFGMSPNPNEPYDIFLWKGGGKLSEAYPFGTCRHFWVRETYAMKDRKGKVDVYSPKKEIVSPSKSIKESGFQPTINDSRAYIAPHDM